MFNNGSSLTQRLTYARTNFGFDVEFLLVCLSCQFGRLFGRHRSGDFDPGRKTILDVSPPGDPHLGYLHPNRCERQRRPAILPRVLHIHPLVLIDLGKTAGSKDVLTVIVAYTALPCVGFLVYDFLYYWFHRILHNITVLWRVHSVHHSIEELNAVNDYHHWLEDALRVPLILVPMSLLVRVDATVLIICIMILRFMGQMTHANSKISYGFLRYVIAEPRFHRIHHSLEERHFDKNFAFMFPMWDVIFGTAYFPARDEYPKTGLANQREPESVLEYVVSPFQNKSADAEILVPPLI